MTEGYKSKMSHDARVRYDIYCQKAWEHVHEMVYKDLHNEPRSRAAIQWLATFHYQWLIDNPAFFERDEFWRAIEVAREEPDVILRHRPMPTLSSGEIDWDEVANDYHAYVLSPYDPMLLAEDRNLLVNEIRTIAEDYSSDNPLRIADFGCGPGSLLPSVQNLNVSITGVDLSQGSLNAAEQRAKALGIQFEAICADLKTIEMGRVFDVIVSSNSILPSKRSEVVPMLKGIQRHLSENGRAYFVMPSFDTTEYLQELWRRSIKVNKASQNHPDRVAEAISRSKLSDPVNLMYADDGHTQQCYHTPDSIAREFAQAGLRIVEEPKKIYYPWRLTRKFDYGWFPDAPEEIWDWYVVAEKL